VRLKKTLDNPEVMIIVDQSPDERREVMKKEENLVGCWFHRPRPIAGCKSNFNQGQIIKKINNKTYQIQLYSFISGLPTKKEKVTIEEINEYELFGSNAEMYTVGLAKMNINPTANCQLN
jgi:hypothetical protein